MTERVDITILFTDMVGSTRLSEFMSTDDAHDLRRQHFSILRRAIAKTGGTEVKNLGDGVMAVFASASAAIACAIAMQQGVERDNRNRDEVVGLRVGLSGGEVVHEDDDYFGDPVVEASRLCDRCEPGQILVADVVRLMAGRRSRHEARSLGKQTLKGLSEPIEIVEVSWEPLTAVGSGVPLPGRLAVRPAVGVVGRDAELEQVAQALKRVTSGEGREILLISGEAGLGKTTLVAEAARLTFESGAVVLFGHCEEDLATPYQLFAEALGHYVANAHEDDLLSHVQTHGSELAPLVPALARRIPVLPPSRATDAESERYLLFASVVALLGQASQDQPVVLVLDDLQWADRGSLLLLRHLAAAEHAMRLLVLAIYRDSQLSQASALRETLGVLHQHPGCGRVKLTGLDDQGVISFMESAAGHQLDDAGINLAHAVHQETDGNPFFVGEVLRDLAETGAIYQNSLGRWVADESLDRLALPDSVRQVIGGRVARLGDTALHVLSLAAVIGRDFDIDLLTKASTTSEDDLLDILDGAASAALVREAPDSYGRYSFSHALIQHTLYEDLGPTRRARAHRRVAEALEAMCGDQPGPRVGELARHWVNATRTVELEKAIFYSRQAADAALAGLAPADALRYYAKALDLCSEGAADPLLEIDLAIGLGTAQRQTGEVEYRDTLLGAARRAAELGDIDRLATAAVATNRGFFSRIGTIDVEKVAILEEAIERLPKEHHDRPLLLATLCSEIAVGAPLERRKALADEALALADAVGDEALMVWVLNNVAYPLMVPPLHEESLSRTADAMVRAQRLGDPVHRYFAALWRGQAAHLACDLEETDRCLELMRALAEQLEQPLLNWVNAFHAGWRAFIAGDFVQGEHWASQALEIGTNGGQPDANLIFGGQLIDFNYQRGTLGELMPVIEQLVVGAPEVAQVLKGALALAHAEVGDAEKTRQLLAEFAAANCELPMDPIWVTGIAFYAAAAIAVDDASVARAIAEQLEPYANQWSSNGSNAYAPFSLYLGGLMALLQRYDEAEAYFVSTASLSRRSGAKFVAAQTDLLWGRMLADRNAPGDRDRARELLSQARGAARNCGYTGLEHRAAEALGRLDR